MEEIAKLCERIRDPEIRAGFKAAVYQNLLPARTDREYRGHFSITADGRSFGTENTWPGLDSWQMAGAYLALGETSPALGYFRFVRASQRGDGNLPFAVFPAEACRAPESRQTYLKGMKYPEDVFRFESGGGVTREWIGLYRHWVAENPLSALAAVCHILTASEIFASTGDRVWLCENLESVRRAGDFLLSLRAENGLYAGCAFYIEMIPRKEYDGTAQCYIFHALKSLSALCAAAGEPTEAEKWDGAALALRKAFCGFFIREGHCGEYVHPERGLVDIHGLTDVNFAAIAFGLRGKFGNRSPQNRISGGAECRRRLLPVPISFGSGSLAGTWALCPTAERCMTWRRWDGSSISKCMPPRRCGTGNGSKRASRS